MSKKILVVGSGGMLGKDVVACFEKDGYEVFGISRDVEGNNMSDHILLGDITKKTFISDALAKIKPDVIVNCAAIVNVDACENNKKLAQDVHVGATRNLAEHKGAKFIYISTDSVYDGQRGNYKEEDQTNPVNYYATTKLEGELACLNANPKAIVLRTNIYGFHLPLGKSLAEWAIDSLSRQIPIKGFTDTFFNPLYTKQLAEIIKFFSFSDYEGVYNTVSDEVVSKYDFLVRLAEKFGFSKELISKAEISGSEQLVASRPKNTYLNRDKLVKVLGETRISSFKEGLDWLYKDYKDKIGAHNGH
jgi:dTDP-4-dehydrorhamnose reductase